MSVYLLLLYPEIMKNKYRITNATRQKQVFTQICLRILMAKSFRNAYEYLHHFLICLFVPNWFLFCVTAMYYWI